MAFSKGTFTCWQRVRAQLQAFAPDQVELCQARGSGIHLRSCGLQLRRMTRELHIQPQLGLRNLEGHTFEQNSWRSDKAKFSWIIFTLLQ